MGFWNLKVHPEWHTSLNKTTPIPTRSYPLSLPKQSSPPDSPPRTEDQTFKYVSLWVLSHSNHHTCGSQMVRSSFLSSKNQTEDVRFHSKCSSLLRRLVSPQHCLRYSLIELWLSSLGNWGWSLTSVLLHPPPEYWNYKCVPHPAFPVLRSHAQSFLYTR